MVVDPYQPVPRTYAQGEEVPMAKNPPDIPTHNRAAPTDKPPAPKKETSAADGTRFGQKDPA